MKPKKYSCISCRKESGVKKTISQVENIDFIPLAQNMGLNTTINIKYLAANFIFKYI